MPASSPRFVVVGTLLTGKMAQKVYSAFAQDLLGRVTLVGVTVQWLTKKCHLATTRYLHLGLENQAFGNDIQEVARQDRSESAGDRTQDPQIKSLLLYQLSYRLDAHIT